MRFFIFFGAKGNRSFPYMEHVQMLCTLDALEILCVVFSGGVEHPPVVFHQFFSEG